MFEQFEKFLVDVNGIRIGGRISRPTTEQRPPLLLLHGHPETHLMWHRVAARLAEHYTVVAPDLRGYGASAKPDSDAGDGPVSEAGGERGGGSPHATYSKRIMAQDQVLLMEHFGAERGFKRFAICAHDRGARVAARLLADHPNLVSKAILLDIAPTLDMYNSTDRAFAEAYFHWFFLIQPRPLPEALIEADPRAYVENLMGRRHAGLVPFPRELLDAYVESLSQPGAVHAMCEDYRASASIDLDHDRQDRENNRLIDTPLRVLWGRHGAIEKLFDPLTLWAAIAPTVTGRAIDTGHYLPEEAPEEVLEEILTFL